MNYLLVFLTSALACGVEMVEAATIVLAMAITRGNRSAIAGAAVALLLLAVVIALFSPLLGAIPLNPLRMFIGIVAFFVGFKWLKKAILRASGRKALHDEEAIFKIALQTGSQTVANRKTFDKLGFVVSFKGVLVEGVECIVIVIAVGGAHRAPGVAALGALASLLIVTAAAVALRKPLSRVPENTLKLAVGVMLLSFGTFWSIEGTGSSWPTGDPTIVLLIAIYAAASTIFIRRLRIA